VGQEEVDVLLMLLLSLGEKRARTVFCIKKNRKFIAGIGSGILKNKKMAGKHFPIGIGIGKIHSKKCPESGIPWNSGGIPADFPTKRRMQMQRHHHRHRHLRRPILWGG
jgi:hypothetical protein